MNNTHTNRRTRMNTRVTLSALSAFALFAFTTSAHAQTSTADCNVTPPTIGKPQDVCQKVVDLFTFLSPQVGVAVSGGNPMLGEGGTLGGLGKVSFSFHTSIVDGHVPKNDVTIKPSGNAASSDFGAQRVPVLIPALDAAVGVFTGVPVGLTNVGGVDILLGTVFVPRIDRGSLAITPEGSGFSLAYGVRVGILQESAAAPGVSVSYKHSKLPNTSFLYSGFNDTLSVDRATLSTNSLRVVVAKRFEIFGVAAGFGRDAIDASSRFSAVINDVTIPVGGGRLALSIPAAHQKVSRNTMFANVSIGYPILQVTAELGYSSAGKLQPTLNSFGGRQANEGYHYGSIGIGFRL